MAKTPNMNLEVWSNEKDHFSHAGLAENFTEIDEHDHSTGKGVQVKTAGIEHGAVTNPLLADEAVNGAKIQKNSINTSQMDPNFIPLGTMTTWYRATGDERLPGGGWEICDGRPWSGITNSLGYSSGNIPDCRGKFLRGASLEAAPIIGATGGSSSVNLSHSHSVESHAHTVGAHTHGVNAHTHTISSDGTHKHEYEGDHPSLSAYNLTQRKVGKPAASPVEALVLTNKEIESGEEIEVPMLESGAHTHGGNTGSSGGGSTQSSTGFSTSSAAPSTDGKLGSVELNPPYVAALVIMKVR